MSNSKVRILALYLPQFHPIPENDVWWGKGFTEWTNVGKAKPLFKGHYQPRVPADLGYYDLRLPESRIAQAELAKEHGIEGFCYWHYWFGNGKQLLERPFNEVLKSGQPNFPFCLAWANHSWEDKLFNKEGSKLLLIKQEYPGEADHLMHFNAVLPAFKDMRYIRVDNKPLFLIHDPMGVPDLALFIANWQKWAKANGLLGIHFVAHAFKVSQFEYLKNKGFDAVNLLRLFDFVKREYSWIERLYNKTSRIIFGRGLFTDYAIASKYFHGLEDAEETVYPTIIPNWDHSPRSGRRLNNLYNSTPEAFQRHAEQVIQYVSQKSDQHKIIFLKSWNEWAEGNYMEPDLKFGRKYLEALKRAIHKNDSV